MDEQVLRESSSEADAASATGTGTATATGTGRAGAALAVGQGLGGEQKSDRQRRRTERLRSDPRYQIVRPRPPHPRIWVVVRLVGTRRPVDSPSSIGSTSLTRVSDPYEESPLKFIFIRRGAVFVGRVFIKKRPAKGTPEGFRIAWMGAQAHSAATPDRRNQLHSRRAQMGALPRFVAYDGGGGLPRLPWTRAVLPFCTAIFCHSVGLQYQPISTTRVLSAPSTHTRRNSNLA